MELTGRLAALAEYVTPGAVAADIGTDHAYLPIYLVKRGICPRVIATELNPGPFQAAARKLKEYGLTARVELRLGDGLQTLRPGEAAVLVLAGMGGNTIKEILAAAPAVLSGAGRLVLQPMADPGDLRSWLAASGWRLMDEELVEEDGRLYVIMAAEPGLETADDPLLLELGPRLLEKRAPLLEDYLNTIIAKYERVLAGLAAGRSDAAREKERELKLKLARIRRMADGGKVW